MHTSWQMLPSACSSAGPSITPYSAGSKTFPAATSKSQSATQRTHLIDSVSPPGRAKYKSQVCESLPSPVLNFSLNRNRNRNRNLKHLFGLQFPLTRYLSLSSSPYLYLYLGFFLFRSFSLSQRRGTGIQEISQESTPGTHILP